jgi:hypothetical protein
MTRHVPAPPKPRRPSVQEPRKSPGLTFQWERFSAIARELPPLFERHWQEIALDHDAVPLAPDWDSYYDLELRGILHILTARADGALAGYIFNLIGGHQHYISTRCAHTEMFWLAPRWRRGWQPVTFFLENLRGLKDREVVLSTVNYKWHFQQGRVGRLFARLGYRPTDVVCRKLL